MNAKTVIAIALAALILVAISRWMNDPGTDDTAAGDIALMPQLAANINEISKIRITDASGNAVTVIAEDDTWRVAEKARYPADAGKVKALALALADARILEEKTSNPDYYARLGVRDIAVPESAAVLVELDGTNSYALLVGNSSPRAGGATLVRRQGESTALLVSQTIDADTDVAEWLDTRVLDISADEIQSVVVQRGKDQRISISKAAMFDTDFSLEGIGEDQQADMFKLNALARNLAGLEFEDVIRSVAFAIGDYSFLDVTYTLFNGVVIDVKVFYPSDTERENKRYWFAASARFDAGIARKFVPRPEAETEDTAGDDEEDAEAGPPAPAPVELTAADIEDRRRQADDINARLQGWMYEITASRFDTFNNSASDLVTEQPAPQ